MTVAASQKISHSASRFPRLPWPPPKQGIHITICESRHAVYALVRGVSEWHLTCPRPWIYCLPTRHAHGRDFSERCGEPERLTLFSGVNEAARVQAQAIFERLAAHLCAVAARDGAR